MFFLPVGCLAMKYYSVYIHVHLEAKMEFKNGSFVHIYVLKFRNIYDSLKTAILVKIVMITDITWFMRCTHINKQFFLQKFPSHLRKLAHMKR